MKCRLWFVLSLPPLDEPFCAVYPPNMRIAAWIVLALGGCLAVASCGDDTGTGGGGACDSSPPCTDCSGAEIEGECTNGFLVCPDISCAGGNSPTGGSSAGGSSAGGAAAGGAGGA